MTLTPRVDPPLQADELETLLGFLDFQRATILTKVQGLDADRLRTAAVPASELTLAGLLKHAALNEDSWIEGRFAGRPLPEPWASAPFDDDPDWEFHSAVDDDPQTLIGAYVAAAERSNATIRSAVSLDAPSVESSRREGTPFSLRWIVLHLIEETARHAGHADLLRESIDGETGE